MPTYEYSCRKCQHHLEEYQSFQAMPLKTCPACGEDELLRLISGGLAVMIPKRKTIGALADKNADEARKQGVATPKSFRRNKPPKERPFWRDTDSVNKKILADPQKYIETGKV